MAGTVISTKSITILQIDKLQGTANFHSWHSIVTKSLGIMGVWDIRTSKASSVAIPLPATSSTPEINTKETIQLLLLPLASSPIAEGALCITSLPTTLDNIINNLTAKEIITYVDICKKLLDLYPAIAQTSPENAVFVTTYCRKEERRARRSWSKDNKLYGYYKSKGFKGVGYLQSKCWTKKCEKNEKKVMAQTLQANHSSHHGYVFPTTTSSFPLEA
ncbi:hypothetical protein L873DRAFT_1903287 [Choiromyces venosus 120613-1]|uniref:Uncharacterized protein n=1 Tax=Choiromyces venosus 120613-1 TaxID=1336337 RepID=A0A3N4IX24_9PEZI|nr:hypothetical protein L873DRAFT_1903287 [Choiromyces venosus 120613-1]